MATGNINVSLRLEQKSWFNAAFAAAYCACTVASLVSYRLADRISEIATSLLARYAFRYIVE
ncbi:hypothetical protein [Novosphingobium resinovorum]|uniref:hypothetical protein n=1 Tax=Novosphingobium resinovorum TaxID=158500 RepID=UPI002ED30010|nr:hypothetical protein [Novosphingobium resinovorum]